MKKIFLLLSALALAFSVHSSEFYLSTPDGFINMGNYDGYGPVGPRHYDHNYHKRPPRWGHYKDRHHKSKFHPPMGRPHEFRPRPDGFRH